VWGTVGSLGIAAGVLFGGALTSGLGWRAVFFINLPFVLAAGGFGLSILRDSKGERGHERFDPVAVPLAAVAVGVLVLGVVQGQRWGWSDARTLACFITTAVLLPLFVVRSARHPAPLLDLDLFRVRSFTVGNTAQALFVGSAFGWLVLMPSFFVHVWGWTPLRAGFGLAPAATIGAVLSPVAGRLADRIGHRGLVVAGTIASAVGTAWWAVMVDADPDYLRAVLPGMVLAGLGITSGFATLTGALMSRIPQRYYSMAGAARSTIFQLATAVGIAIAVAVVDSAGSDSTPSPYRTVWWIASGCALGCAVVVLVAFPRGRATRTSDEDADARLSAAAAH
jgi:MFS family permease